MNNFIKNNSNNINNINENNNHPSSYYKKINISKLNNRYSDSDDTNNYNKNEVNVI